MLVAINLGIPEITNNIHGLGAFSTSPYLVNGRGLLVVSYF